MPATETIARCARITVRVRASTVALLFCFAAMAMFLGWQAPELPAAHEDESIQYVSSDAATYYAQYRDVWAGVALEDDPTLLLNGTPIVLMKLTGGNLMPILFANLLLMLCALRAAMRAFDSGRARWAILLGALVFPYFLFGFLSLNKEVYAMCSALFFLSWYLRGSLRHLAFALMLALAARYYMLLAMLFVVVVFPRTRPPRYWVAWASLAAISALAPIVKSRIPGYSSEGLLDGAGATSLLFANMIDNHLYIFVYPIKYLVLVPTRLYSLTIGLGRSADLMESIVSALTVLVLVGALGLLALRLNASDCARRLTWMAICAPIPLMWTEIGHWRYFSYVYFFLLAAMIVHTEQRRRLRREHAAQDAAT